MQPIVRRPVRSWLAGLVGVSLAAAAPLVGGCTIPDGFDDLGRTDAAQQIPTDVDPYETAPLLPPPPEGHTLPARVVAYHVVPEFAPVSLQDLMVEFAVYGEPVWDRDGGGTGHVEAFRRHVFVYPDGAGRFVDEAHMWPYGGPIEAMPDELLYDAADGLLERLGVVETDRCDLKPRTVVPRFEPVPAVGAALPKLTHQVAIYGVRVDKLPAIGPGADVEIVFHGDDFPVGFRHGVRGLQPVRNDTPLPRDKALSRWLARLRDGEHWSVWDQPAIRVLRVEIDDVRLGHYLPAVGAPAIRVEPVWRIEGLIEGHVDSGAPVLLPFLWFEPAIDGRDPPLVDLLD